MENGGAGATYVVGLQGNVPVSHPSNLSKAQERERERQMLINEDPHSGQNPLSSLTKQELVAKVNEAIAQLEARRWISPLNVKGPYQSARPLKFKGITKKSNERRQLY
jgi:hypothetical protein